MSKASTLSQVVPRRSRPTGLRALVAAFLAYRERRRAARYLAGLDDFLLADIGVQRADIERVVRGA